MGVQRGWGAREECRRAKGPRSRGSSESMCLSPLLQSGPAGRFGVILTVVSFSNEQEGIGEVGEWGYKEAAQELLLPGAAEG